MIESSSTEGTGQLSSPDDVDGSPDIVLLAIDMSRRDFDTLVEGARAAQVSPAEFVAGSISLARTITKERELGNRILIFSRWGNWTGKYQVMVD